MRHRPLLLLLLLLLTAALALSCSRTGASTYQKSKPLMDTFITITVVAESESTASKAIETAFRRIEQFGSLVNFFSEDSELAMVNKNAGLRATRVSPETLDVIEQALYVAAKSGGAFDPTIGPVMKLWDFHKKTRPTDSEIREKLPLVNYRNVRVDRQESTVFLLGKGMLLDLGGIAKGYAADLAAGALKEAGIKAGIVAVAGDIKTFGLRPDGKPWNVGIRNPRHTGEKDEILATLRLTDKAISTAGDYERYFMADGQRYHHILDPSTGLPAKGMRSVSVVTDRGVLADGFDNAIFVLGPDRGLKLAGTLGKDFPVEAITIDDQGVTRTTSGLEGALKIEAGP